MRPSGSARAGRDAGDLVSPGQKRPAILRAPWRAGAYRALAGRPARAEVRRVRQPREAVAQTMCYLLLTPRKSSSTDRRAPDGDHPQPAEAESPLQPAQLTADGAGPDPADAAKDQAPRHYATASRGTGTRLSAFMRGGAYRRPIDECCARTPRVSTHRLMVASLQPRSAGGP